MYRYVLPGLHANRASIDGIHSEFHPWARIVIRNLIDGRVYPRRFGYHPYVDEDCTKDPGQSKDVNDRCCVDDRFHDSPHFPPNVFGIHNLVNMLGHWLGIVLGNDGTCNG